jgi:hypothetical protein
MRRWCGWGEKLIKKGHRNLKDAVKATRCVGAGIGTHEVVAEHMKAGYLRRLVENLVPGGGKLVLCLGIRVPESFRYAPNCSNILPITEFSHTSEQRIFW